METNTDVWQGLMDTAYDRWRHNETWHYKEFLNQCSPDERKAVLLGNCVYQINNGGFSQWVDNGYALHGKEVCEYLINLANDVGCVAAAELAGKIDKLLDFVDLTRENRGFNDYWIRSHRDYEDDYNEGAELAQSMDKWFYREIEPKLVPAIEKWLSRKGV